MRKLVIALALVAALAGCASDGSTGVQLTLADYAPLIDAFVQAVDAYADEKLGVPDTPEGRLILATKSIAVQAALLQLKRAGFTESQVIAYLETRDAAKAEVAEEAVDAGEAAMDAVEPEPAPAE